MNDGYLIGLDFGSESARGVLLDAQDGTVLGSLTHAYTHSVMSECLPGGQSLPKGWALQHAPDYSEAAAVILGELGGGRRILSIGVGFTASSPLPCRADGTPLSVLFPDRPHAYVKLWKHQAAQPWADRINSRGGDYLINCGGRLSGEWLLAKAAQLAEEAPDLWRAADRFIEAGDWLVWQLTGQEVRSQSFATYKAQYRAGHGYPSDVVAGLSDKLGAPLPIGSRAGCLSPSWRARTGIEGDAVIAVAVIDSHVAMPALGVVDSGTLMGALGTSAAYLLLDRHARELPAGIEGMAYGAAIPGVWCYEAGQACFGDVLAWFMGAFPRSGAIEESYTYYHQAAANSAPANRLLALDWWNGCRVPHADSSLSGLLLGLNMRTTAVDIYRALLEALCFGARSVVERMAGNGAAIDRVVLTGGLSQKNDFLMQLLADVLGRELNVPQLPHPTAIGAAIHGAVAAGTVADYAAGARRYGAREFKSFTPNPEAHLLHAEQYQRYCELSANAGVRQLMHGIA